MNSRTIRSTVKLAHPFRTSGYDDQLPMGSYEVVSDMALLEGLSFEANRKRVTYLMIGG